MILLWVCPALVSVIVLLQHIWSLYQCYFSLDNSGMLLLLSLLLPMNTTLLILNSSISILVIPLMNQGLKLTRFVNWNICLFRQESWDFFLFSFYSLTSTCSVAMMKFQEVQRTLKMYIRPCIQREGWEQVDRKILNCHHH